MRRAAAGCLLVLLLAGCAAHPERMASPGAGMSDRDHVLVNVAPFRVATIADGVTLDEVMAAMAEVAEDGSAVPPGFSYRLDWRGDRGLLRVEQDENAVTFVMWFAARTRPLSAGGTRLELQPLLGWRNGAAASEAVARGRLDSGLRAHLQAIGRAAQP